MNIVVYAAPTTEPLSTSEVMTHCKLDESNVEPAPSVITVALAAVGAGNVDNGVHRWLATFVTAAGETQAGTVSAAITVVDKTTNGKVGLSAIPVGGTLVTSRKLYRTIAGGSTYLLLATLADNTTTTYIDNIADSALGAGAPSTNTTSDPQLVLLIASARAAAEKELKRYLITQTLDAYLDAFPCHPNKVNADLGPPIRLPPLQSVTSITYVDENGVTQTLPVDQYTVDATSKPARITPAFGCSWPTTRVQTNAVIVRFIAGYGVAAAVPANVKSWMLIQIDTLRTNPSAIVIGANGLAQMPATFVDGLLDNERVTARIT